MKQARGLGMQCYKRQCVSLQQASICNLPLHMLTDSALNMPMPWTVLHHQSMAKPDTRIAARGRLR